jgi:hypothetical protein
VSLEDEGGVDVVLDGVLVDGVLVVDDGLLIELSVDDGDVAGEFILLSVDGVVVLVSAGLAVLSYVCA